MSRHYSDAIAESDFYAPGGMDYAPEPDPDTPNEEDDEEFTWPPSRIDDAADRSVTR